MAERKSFPFKIAAAIAAAIGAGWLLLRKYSGAPSGCTEAGFRQRVVDAAKSEVGQKNLNKYFADAAPQYVGQHPEWCGIFALWTLHQADLAKAVIWKTGIGFLRAKDITSDPKPGDIAYFEQYQHQAVVLAVHADTVELANGNGSGGVVSLSTTPRMKAKAYYSIAGYIAEAIAACSPGTANAAPATAKWSGDAKTLQTDLNKILAANGKTLLSVDGKAGPKTCEAAKWAVANAREHLNHLAGDAGAAQILSFAGAC